MTTDRAPNRYSYYEQGVRAARRGNTRSPGNEYTMPVFGTRKSWQSKAFAEGFRAECGNLQRAVTPAK